MSVYPSEQMLENRENLPLSATFRFASRDLSTPVLAGKSFQDQRIGLETCLPQRSRNPVA
jgi:hypothetical protein